MNPLVRSISNNRLQKHENLVTIGRPQDAVNLRVTNSYHRAAVSLSDSDRQLPLTTELKQFFPSLGGYSKMIIIGDDDDRVETENSSFPYSCIVRIHAYFKHRVTPKKSTGFLIGPRCIATAGHAVCHNKKWPERVEVIAMRKRGKDVSGVVLNARTFRTVGGWFNQHNPDYDYGAVILEDNTLFQLTKSFFGFSPSIKVGEEIVASGYEARSPQKFLRDAGEVVRLSERHLRHTADTMTGQSGSPVWNHLAQVVGIHHMGVEADQENQAMRIVPEILGRFNEWNLIK